MDREYILKISKLYHFNPLKLANEDLDNIIRNYCKDNGKSDSDIEYLINSISTIVPFKLYLFKTALGYYEAYFNIIKVQSKEELNTIPPRRIIYIF